MNLKDSTETRKKKKFVPETNVLMTQKTAAKTTQQLSAQKIKCLNAMMRWMPATDKAFYDVILKK